MKQSALDWIAIRAFDLIITIFFYLLPLAGLVLHIITCLYEDRVGLLIAGIIIFPIGVVHGWGLWLELW
jgi:hypothetical protein